MSLAHSNRFAAVVAVLGFTLGLVGPAFGFALRTDDSGVYVTKWYQSPIVMWLKLPTDHNLIDGKSLRSSVHEAMQIWDEQLGAVSFSAILSTPGAYANGNDLNEVVIDRTIDGDTFPAGVLAISISYEDGNNVPEADIIFNSAFTWNSYRGSLRRDLEDIRRVAIHELGHVLGLDHPDEAGQMIPAIMNRSVSNVDGLLYDDILGGQALYGAPGVVPANDSFAHATALTLTSDSAEATGSNVLATREANEPWHAGSTGEHSLWWKWTASHDGIATLSTLGSNFDTALAVYTGTGVGALSVVGANDDEESTEQNSGPQRRRSSLVAFTASAGTTYYVAVDGWGREGRVPAGYTGSIALRLSFTPQIPPSFTTQPMNTTVKAGQSAIFSVSATGTPAPTLHWERSVAGGVWVDLRGDYSDATNPSFNVLTTFGMNGDRFRCVATNIHGTATSEIATLTVTAIALPVIESHPGSITLNLGESAGISVRTFSAASFQWYRNGVLLPGQTSRFLSFPTVNLETAGDYYVVLTNAGGSITSQTATITVVPLPAVTNVTASRLLAAPGEEILLKAVVDAPGPVDLQWYHNGRPIDGAVSEEYQIRIADKSRAGAFWLKAVGEFGTGYGAPIFILWTPPRSELVVWGSNENGQASLPPNLGDVIAADVGAVSAAAVRRDGSVVQWGDYAALAFPAGLTDVVAVAVGTDVALALRADGTVVAGGEVSLPVDLRNVVAIDCGGQMAALKTDGTVVIWHGYTLAPGERNIVALSAGDNDIVGVAADNTSRKWGYSSTFLADMQNLTKLVAGKSHAVGLTTDSTVLVREPYPEQSLGTPPGLAKAIDVATGSSHILVLHEDRTITGWGLNDHGQTAPPAGYGDVFAIAAGGSTSLALRETNPTRQPSITQHPRSQAASAAGGAVILAAEATRPNGAPVVYRWERNGIPVPAASEPTLTLGNIQPSDTGVYRSVIAGPDFGTTRPAIVGLSDLRKVVGSATEIGADIHHSNGNIFDQILLEGAAASFRADSALGQITRLSFVDLTDDIVQVELSGPGTVSIVLAGSSGPAAPINYRQPDVSYMRGHAGIVVAGATRDTHLTVFSVGRANAVNQTLFRDDANYDGYADLAFIAILSDENRFGGLRTANVNYWADTGLTGVYAPDIQFDGPLYIGNITASGAATPTITAGAAPIAQINGGDLLQLNARPVEVRGLDKLYFVANGDSHGNAQPAQPNRARLDSDGVDVTSTIVVAPSP